MVNQYTLVNPYIVGKINTTVKAKNSHDAATQIYKSISEHFNNEVSEFYFTLMKGGSIDTSQKNTTGKYYNFKVNENRKKNEVSFSINEIELNDADYINTKFKGKLEEYKKKIDNKQSGGKKKLKKKKSKSKSKSKKEESESSDSDLSSESDDIYLRTRKKYYSEPIYYWWYDPFVYRLDNIFVPTFYSYTTPAAVTISVSP